MGLAAKLKNWMWDTDDAYGAEEQCGVEPVSAFEEEQSAGIVLFKPGVYVDAGLIADQMCQGFPVLLDIGGLSKEAVRRIVDFLSGAAYGRDGQLVQVSSKAYLLVPHNVEFLDDTVEERGDWSYDGAFSF